MAGISQRIFFIWYKYAAGKWQESHWEGSNGILRERTETDQHKSGSDFTQWIHTVRLESTTMFIY